jgi:hypothetical protein
MGIDPEVLTGILACPRGRIDILSSYYIKIAEMLEIQNWRTVEMFMSISSGVLEALDDLAAKASSDFNLAEPELAKSILFITDTGKQLKRMMLAGIKPADPGWALSTIYKKMQISLGLGEATDSASIRKCLNKVPKDPETEE